MTLRSKSFHIKSSEITKIIKLKTHCRAMATVIKPLIA